MSDIAQIQVFFERHCARLPDPVGMRVYSDHLAAGTSLATLEAAIASSDEARRVAAWRRITGKLAPETESDRAMLLSVRLPTPVSAPPPEAVAPPTTPAESEVFIASVYMAILGRSPDPVGMQAYCNAIANGLPLMQVVEDVLTSEEARRANGPSTVLDRVQQLRRLARRLPLVEALCNELANAAAAREFLRLWNQRMPRGPQPPP